MKLRGGERREIKIADDDIYGWWLMGIDMIEMGTSQNLAGVRLMKKAVKMMADEHDKGLKMTDQHDKGGVKMTDSDNE